MADFNSLAEMLEELRQKVNPDLQPQVEEIMDALGRLQVEVGQQEEIAQAQAPFEPPTTPSLEIVGGVETDDFPDCCAVGDDVGYYCSGTLIAPNVVVTADHCDGVTRVFLRGNNIEDPNEGETLAVLQEFSHPEVDLKVLVLEMESEVAPRAIGQGSLVNDATQATLVGFGYIDPEGTYGYGQKRRVEVPIMTLNCGNPDDPKRYGCLPGREIVAGHSGLMLDTCNGDSGGPLYVRQSDGQYYLLGATSRGARGRFHKCGDGGIYVRVDLCLDWIREVTGASID